MALRPKVARRLRAASLVKPSRASDLQPVSGVGGKRILTGRCNGWHQGHRDRAPPSKRGAPRYATAPGRRNGCRWTEDASRWRRAMSSTQSAISPKVGQTGRPSAKDESAKTILRRGSPGRAVWCVRMIALQWFGRAIGGRSRSKARPGSLRLSDSLRPDRSQFVGRFLEGRLRAPPIRGAGRFEPGRRIAGLAPGLVQVRRGGLPCLLGLRRRAIGKFVQPDPPYANFVPRALQISVMLRRRRLDLGRLGRSAGFARDSGRNSRWGRTRDQGDRRA